MRRTLAMTMTGVVSAATLAWAAGPVIVSQVDRHFSVASLTVKRGEVVRFSNDDEFVHHIYVRSPSFSFNSGEQEPGKNVDVPFSVPGQFDVRCEIHPRMRLSVTVL